MASRHAQPLHGLSDLFEVNRPHYAENSKSESPNPKQIQNPKLQ
jgi:hypothetical protein